MKKPIPDADDLDAWTRVWSRYPGQIISVAKNGCGAIRLEAGRKVIVRKNLATILKALYLPEASRS
jgi:hypothetical protein